jgi:ribosomal protein S18 acetylase RimI-like enzyme
MINIVDATNEDIPAIQQIAEETWWPTYSSIVSKEQIRYMLDAIYSTEALQSAMKNGSQSFIILHDENGAQGFASYGYRVNEPGVYKLHKIYVLPANHGKGYGKLLIEEVKKRMSLAGSYILDLNVNRHNPAKSFYEKIGFQILREEDVSIGPYWMNDYVMRLEFTP